MTAARISFWIMGALSLLVALATLRFLPLSPEVAFASMKPHLAARPLAFWLHALASPVALAAGVFQFAPRLRARHPRLHRLNGRLYGLAVLAGGLSALALAIGAWPERPVAAAGFGLLALMWLGTTGQAVRLARRRDFARHRRWMIRSFALAFAAVTLRLLLPVFMLGAGMDYAGASLWVAWLCWVPNLIFAEWWLARDRSRPAAAPRPGRRD